MNTQEIVLTDKTNQIISTLFKDDNYFINYLTSELEIANDLLCKQASLGVDFEKDEALRLLYTMLSMIEIKELFKSLAEAQKGGN